MNLLPFIPGLPSLVSYVEAFRLVMAKTTPLLLPEKNVDPSFRSHRVWQVRLADRSLVWCRLETKKERDNRLEGVKKHPRILDPTAQRRVYEGKPLWFGPGENFPVILSELVRARLWVVADEPTSQWLEKRAGAWKHMRDNFTILKPFWRPECSTDAPTQVTDSMDWAFINSECSLVKSRLKGAVVEIVQTEFLESSRHEKEDEHGGLHTLWIGEHSTAKCYEVFVAEQGLEQLLSSMSPPKKRADWHKTVEDVISQDPRQMPRQVIDELVAQRKATLSPKGDSVTFSSPKDTVSIKTVKKVISDIRTTLKSGARSRKKPR